MTSFSNLSTEDSKVPKICFKGPKDFRAYGFAVKARLIKANCHDVTLGNDLGPGDAPDADADEETRSAYRKAIKAFKKKCIDGYSILIETFQQNSEFDPICEKAKLGDGPSLWKAIIEHVQASDPATQARLIDEFEKIKQADTEPVAQYLSRLYAASQQLSNPPSLEQLKLRAGKMMLKKYQSYVFPETMKSETNWPTFLEACRQVCTMHDTMFNDDTTPARPGLIAAVHGGRKCDICTKPHQTTKCHWVTKAKRLMMEGNGANSDDNPFQKRTRFEDHDDDEDAKQSGHYGTYHMNRSLPSSNSYFKDHKNRNQK